MYGYGSSPLEILACQAMVQGLIYTDQFYYKCDWVAGTPTGLPANGDKTSTIQINSDSDFIAQEYHLSVTQANGDQFVTLPPLLITITRAGSGRDIMNGPIVVTNLCGNFGGYALQTGNVAFANFPGRLSITSLYQGNTTVSVRLQNPTNVAFQRVDFVMSGFKAFYQTNQAGQTGNRQDVFHAL